MYRQGDVLLVPVKQDFTGVEADKVTLALGEVTGHAHVLKAPRIVADKLQLPNFVKFAVPAELLHEEHDRIEIPAGTYRIKRQREYTPQEIRNVAD